MDEPIWINEFIDDFFLHPLEIWYRSIREIPTTIVAQSHLGLTLQVGEPIIYPRINEFIDELHKRRISSFMVTNAQFPEQMEDLVSLSSNLSFPAVREREGEGERVEAHRNPVGESVCLCVGVCEGVR